jgi:activating signal cointegrator complex subunit 3
MPPPSYTPTLSLTRHRFPKVKEEGWWLVVGHPVTRQLLALRRVSFGARPTTTRLTFSLPPHLAAAAAAQGHSSGWGDSSSQHQQQQQQRQQQGPVVRLYLMSDCYLGLDQQYDVPLQG